MTVGNQYGYLCPNCDKGTEILITASAEVLLTLTGTDIDTNTAPVWNSTSFVDCLNCGWAGTVGDLLRASIKKAPAPNEMNAMSGSGLVSDYEQS